MESKIHKTAIILFLFNNAIHLQGVPKIKHNGLHMACGGFEALSCP
jgi:hypothetical protein